MNYSDLSTYITNLFKIGERLSGRRMKEMMKTHGINFRNVSKIKLLHCDIKDELLYEYTGECIIDNEGVSYVFKEIENISLLE